MNPEYASLYKNLDTSENVEISDQEMTRIKMEMQISLAQHFGPINDKILLEWILKNSKVFKEYLDEHKEIPEMWLAGEEQRKAALEILIQALLGGFPIEKSQTIT